ncbi:MULTISPECIES: hypothetical protein [Flavobacteriaceae]|uniref:hypothetical protein n=1 Tax=Flavobacteriaceae TaxID=49546 RepID=UPI0010ADBA7D|nr:MULTISPECIES: hypothetical protein [Flavobacteriaceae]NJB37880.1 hypothetical protein [Croceivirga sp. JEA036]TKD60468.1 hypothetical protein FBT53_12735 [Flavobacterium sp. ASW18X]
MRKQLLFSLTIIMSCCLGLTAQDKKQSSGTKETPKKEMNLMDEQAKLFGKLFGDMEQDLDGTKDPFKDVKNYENLLNRSKMDPETKSKMRAMYLMYDQSLDPGKKDSLKVSLEKMFEAHIKKTEKQH